MDSPNRREFVVVFPAQLGWFALVGSGSILRELSFGHPSREAALKALSPDLLANAREGLWNPSLVDRLRAYASGSPDDFLDVPLDFSDCTPFERRVLRCCRHIPLGKTSTYGQLAAKAGSPGAARAVGRSMAHNRVPLVVPCHRVIGADGELRGYSAAGGISMKRRLLELEAAMVARRPGRAVPGPAAHRARR